MFIRHTPFIRPNTFSKKWAVPFNWISMSKWSTFRYKFVSINLHLLYRPGHMWLIFSPMHFSSCAPLRLFWTPLLIGTREYLEVQYNFGRNFWFLVLDCNLDSLISIDAMVFYKLFMISRNALFIAPTISNHSSDHFIFSSFPSMISD